jgi:uncharacterized protein with HEPN domain
MSRDHRLFLEDIQTSCEKIVRYTRELTFEQFKADEKTLDAVVRNLEIIGEAVKHLRQEVRELHSGGLAYTILCELNLSCFLSHEPSHQP